MVSKKILKDIAKYVLSTKDFSTREHDHNMAYPLDLSFTLTDERAYYNPKDEDGIPYKVYQSVGKQYNPTRIAAYALANFNRYVSEDCSESKSTFLNCADWFLSKKNGRYEYQFNWLDLKSPWISCMAQGEAASVLVRAYELTNNEKYLEQANKSLEPLFLPIDKGGVQSRMADGSMFIEEYPSENPTHVLNGFLYAIIGLKEYAEITTSQRHLELFDRLVCSLCKNIERWRFFKWSLYEDRNKAKGANFCTPSYHSLQITQLKWLNKHVEDVSIQKVIERWNKGLDSFGMRIFALFGKVYFRLINKAQR